MRRIVITGVVLTAGALVGIGALAYSSNSPPQPAAPAVATTTSIPVVGEPVKMGDVPMYLRGIGTMQAYNTAMVRAQVQGQIAQIAFAEGQTVHKGDLLVQI